MSTNEDQIKYWNEEAGPKWVQIESQLDAQIGPIGEHMIELADPKPGERVLDVGCGCGGTSLSFAKRVAPTGRVTGVDISGPMLARARERAKAEGLSNLEFVQADAQEHSFEASSADLVASRFGIMFFADPVAAFRNLRSALDENGRLAFVCWQPLIKNPWMSVPLAAAAPQLPELPPPPAPDAPGPFAFGDPDRVRGILGGAGFEDVEVAPYEATLFVGGNASFDESVDFILRLGPTSRLLGNANEALLQRVRDAVAKAVEPFASSDGIEMECATWLVSARR